MKARHHWQEYGPKAAGQFVRAYGVLFFFSLWTDE